MLTAQESAHVEKIRASINEIEKAGLIEEYFQLFPKRKIVHLAQVLSVSMAYISRYKRLLRLPALVVDGYLSGTISASHLFVLSRLKTEQDMIDVYEHILTKTLAVHQIEDLIREKLFALDSVGERIDKKVIIGFDQLAAWLDKDCRVKVIQTRIGVKLVLSCGGNLAKTSHLLSKLAKRLEIKVDD